MGWLLGYLAVGTLLQLWIFPNAQYSLGGALFLIAVWPLPLAVSIWRLCRGENRK